MHREDLREGKEAKELIHSLTIKGTVVEIKRKWKEHERLFLPIQKHTDRVIELTRFPYPQTIADGVITNLRGVEIGIRTADCAPVALVGEEWIGVVHVGWRGLHAGILERAIEKLLPRERDIFAFVGPCAKGCCYEVGREFLELFPGYVFERGEKLYMDMQESVIKRLKNLGINRIGFVERCTVCSPDLPSYRRNRTEERILTSVRKL